MNLGALFRLTLVVIVPLMVALATYRFMNRAFFAPLDSSATEKKVVEIQPGKSMGEISRAIRDLGVLRNAWSLNLLARLKGDDTKINAGEYELTAAMTPGDVLKKLVAGDVLKRAVLVKEGATIFEVSASVEQAGLMSKPQFDAAVVDRQLLVAAGLNYETFEGYLFPETYFFSRPSTPKQIIWRMLEEGEHHWPAEFTAQADKLSLTRHEILTLASIIQKEAANESEQPLISSVFHNRLNQGMKLQADPTVIYGLANFNGNITKADLQNPHAYNTYVHFGLPPGPIANPGEKAIRAALFPRETSYLFFVADGMGGHVFSTTLLEHNDAVKRYQKEQAAAAAIEAARPPPLD